MLADLTFAELIVLLGGTMAGALVVILVAVLPGKRGVAIAREADESVSFVFDEDELLDATPSGEILLRGSQSTDGASWQTLRQIWEPRFGAMPNRPSEGIDGEDTSVQRYSTVPGDTGRLVFLRAGLNTRVTLFDKPPSEIERQEAHDMRRSLEATQIAINQAPNPIWITDAKENITCCNRAYEELAERLGQDVIETMGPDTLFATDLLQEAEHPVRIPLQTGDDEASRIWFEVATRPHKDGQVFYATNVDAVVRAEVAQRNFVQTLTKTFAQLSIGLAIFDRNQQLALFNPALIDLTMLPAEFLSSRPDLLSFFDHLRDERIMPEPKNYASWRDQMTELVAAARDGRYCETWNLSSGLTYRVSGKPHPDGAVAFLIEDISAEISLTRRFRADLELTHVVLDRQSSALAVFSQLGVLIFSNEAFRSMWDCDPDSSFSETSIAEAVRLWQSHCDNSEVLASLPPFVTGFGPRVPISAEVKHETEGPLRLKVEILPGGSTLVKFTRLTSQTVSGLAQKAGGNSR